MESSGQVDVLGAAVAGVSEGVPPSGGRAQPEPDSDRKLGSRAARAEGEPEPEPQQPRPKKHFSVETGGGLWGKAGGAHGAASPGVGASGVDDGAYSNLAAANAAERVASPLPAELVDALQTIAAVDGDRNWCGLSANRQPKLLGSGYGSLDDARQLLFKPDCVCAALLRLQFKTAGAVLTKNVYVWWSGPQVGAVKRGTLNTQQENVRELIRPHCTIHCSIEIIVKEGAAIGAVIDKVVANISATEEEKALMTEANYRLMLADRAESAEGQQGDSRFMIVTLSLVKRATHVRDFGAERATAKAAWKKCSYEDAHLLLEARGTADGSEERLVEHKSYVSFESSRETCEGAARRHLQWVRDKAAWIASGEWREPSFEDDEGESLVGARVMVRSDDLTPIIMVRCDPSDTPPQPRHDGACVCPGDGEGRRRGSRLHQAVARPIRPPHLV